MTALAVADAPQQGSFDELGTPLREVTFVVVDLETTGGSTATERITEVGAVKVRGGEVLGEFASLVNPGVAIPPFIAVLTGITDALVATAPPIEAVLPAFLEFVGGSDTVLVAHNAPFDVGFLKAACATAGRPWPGWQVLDTARLARRVVTRDESPDCKLASLARLFRSATTPCHRALDDARATVDVLHGMLERLGGLGVHSLDELATFSSRVSPAQRRKRHLAEGLPAAPGVYLFLDGQGRTLYVGKARDLRSRVRTYFTASELRSRMAEMVGLAERVEAIRCATDLEAEVREVRLIAERKPRYNRRSRFPERATWVKLTVEAFPRLSLVREVRNDGGVYLGPFGRRGTAEAAVAAVHDAFRLRQCTSRLSPQRRTAACALAEMGRCGAPCDGRESAEAYGAHVAAATEAMTGDVRALEAALARRLARLVATDRFEEAAVHRDRLAAFIRAAARTQRFAALSRCPELVAARRDDAGGWQVSVVRHGRLAAAGRVPPGVSPRPAIAAIVATAEHVDPAPQPLPAALVEEAECVLRWLETPGTRLVDLAGCWASPAFGAGRHRAAFDVSPTALAPLDDQRRLRPLTRPAR